MNKLQWMDFFREIRKNKGRFLSLLFIVALGCAFYSGIRSSEPDMTASADHYYDETDFCDVRLISTLGLTEQDLTAVSEIEGVKFCEGSYSTELFAACENDEPIMSVVSLGQNINRFTVREGRLPQKADECFVDVRYLSLANCRIGDTITLHNSDKEAPGELTQDTFTIVGCGTWAWYLNLTRGTASIGDGSVDAFLVLLPDAFSQDYYSTIFATVEGAKDVNSYSDAYDDIVQEIIDAIEGISGVQLLERRDTLLAEGQAKLDDAREQIADARQELSDAYDQLQDGEASYQDGLAEYEDGRRQLEEGKRSYADGRRELDQGKQEYQDGLTEYVNGRRQYEDGKASYEQGSLQLEEGKQQLAASKKELEDGWAAYQAGLAEYQAGAALLDEKEKELAAGRAALEEGRQTLEDSKTMLEEKKAEVSSKKTELTLQKAAAETSRKALLAAKELLIAQEGSRPEEKERLIAEISETEALLKETEDPGEKTRLQLRLGGQKAALELLERSAAQTDDRLEELNRLIAQADEGLALLADGLAQIEDGLAQINEGLQEVEAGSAELAAKEALLADGEQQLKEGRQQLAASESILAQSRQTLEEGDAAYQQGASELAEKEQEFEEAGKTLAASAAQLQAAKQQLDAADRKIRDGEKELSDAAAVIADGEQDLADAQKSLEDGRRELDDGWKEYNDAKTEADEKIAEAEAEIADGEKQLADLPEGTWYILTRDTVQTFVEYGMDADRIGRIAKVFPIIFFLVAALVCLTTMTRMVEEERMLIGTMKALGYSKFAIISKYLFYAASATLTGGILGVLVGSKLLPFVIMKAYGMLYTNVPYYLMPYHLKHCLTAIGLALLCTVGAALFACYRELLSTPASLMRPPAPKVGRKIILERIPWLWSRMNFSFKSTVRNLFRYKKRLFMTVLGIGGCMAVLLVSYGLHDSIAAIVDNQYKRIWTYSANCSIDESLDQTDKEALRASLTDTEHVSQTMLARNASLEVSTSAASKTAYIYVVESTAQMAPFLDLHDRLTKESCTLKDSGVILSEKLARQLEVSPGDEITLKISDTEYHTVTVEDTAENYLFGYIYMTPACYRTVFGEDVSFNEIVVRYDLPLSSSEEKTLAEALLAHDHITAVSLATGLQKSVDNMLNALNLVVWVLVIAAGLLVFVVTYNLNTINISERRRELASLKVLGFYDLEVAMYVYRENIFLTIFGIIAGLFMGTWLHRYIITILEVEMIMFGRNISVPSYIYSSLLTVAFSLIVNLFMYYKLRQIDMVESLKSVE